MFIIMPAWFSERIAIPNIYQVGQPNISESNLQQFYIVNIYLIYACCGACVFSGSHGTLLGIINAFVHVIMYSYYFLTSYRPELRNSLWWKKHITQIQLVSICDLKLPIQMATMPWPMIFVYWIRLICLLFAYSFQIQFGILVLHFMNPIFFHDCAWPKAISFIGVIQNLFMFILFLDFYIKAYVRKTKIN